MVNLIEGGGDTFAQRAEMFYNSRPQFIRMVQDLHKSYRSLAEKYDQLRYESVSNSCMNLEIKKTISLKNSNLETSFSDSEYEMLGKKQETDVETWVDVCKFEQDDNKWNEIGMEMTNLIDENSKQTVELIRRNEEKMKEIKALTDNMDKLIEENKSLKDKLAQCNGNMNQNQTHQSELRTIVLGKWALGSN